MSGKIILALDPGDLTGWALMNLKGALLEQANYTLEEVSDRLEMLDPEQLECIIYEDFKLFKKKALQQTGSRFVASQVIGVIKSYARRRAIRLVVQIPDNKNTGALWSGVTHKGSHSTGHYVDAYNHGFYYLRNKYNIPTKLERQLWTKGSPGH